MLAESPAARRNREPILAALKALLPEAARVLEVGSGTGQHAAWFARHLPGVRWQPSDRTDELFGTIEGWARHEGVPSPLAPIRLDVTEESWPAGPFDAVFSANLVHIAPWSACEGLLRGAGRCLRGGGLLVLYGPFRIAGRHTSPSNAAFDESLRARDGRFGVRDLEAVEAVAAEQALRQVRRLALPANNQLVVFQRVVS